MRTSAFLAIAILGCAAPAFAQDRTIPTGALDAVQPPVDWRSSNQAPLGLYEGRSVSEQPVTIQHLKHSHRRG